MKLRNKLLLGALLGATLIFFIPAFPVSLPNIAGTSNSLYWNSGLMQHSLKSLFLIEGIGSLFGVLIAFSIPTKKEKIKNE